MSKDIIVLVPNGRRIKVHCTPDTSFLQVLEDVCMKHGYEPSEYDLKHHNNIVDLTSTIRFCNIPNRATLEMVEAEKRRVESNVTVGLLVADGERRTSDFSPRTSLYDIVMSLAATELPTLKNPTIMYMRQEVTGVAAMKDKTLRQLGLITGRAVLRLFDKTETEQANVSSVYRAKTEKPKSQNIEPKEPEVSTDSVEPIIQETNKPQLAQEKIDSNKFDPIKLLKSQKVKEKETCNKNVEKTQSESNTISNNSEFIPNTETAQCSKDSRNLGQKAMETQENFERRLRIEEEVTFVGSQKAVAFKQPEELQDELSDLPDDFYELSIDEVRKIYHELQQKRMEFEETPLMTTAKREELQKEASQQKLNTYKNVVVRIQFPDSMILQGVFTPLNTIQDINDFVKEHIQDPDRPFQIFTTPLKESLDPKTTLIDAKYVPCVHMHFKWLDDDKSNGYLKHEIYQKQTPSDAASILASKYRAPTRRKLEDTSGPSRSGQSSSSKESKLPKWFKK